MRLSNSISELKTEKLRELPWILIWAISLLLFLTALFFAESRWRKLGYRSSVVDSSALWKFWYEHALCGQTRSIVLIGSSRIQAGISTTTMRQRLPQCRIVQLARSGSGSPIGVLRALAFDDRFKGIVFCDTLEPFLVRRRWPDQREAYEYSAAGRERIEAAASAHVSEILAIGSSTTGLEDAISGLINQGRLPVPDHVRMRADRSVELDFGLVKNLKLVTAENLATYRSAYESAVHPSLDEFDDDFAEIDDFVRRIQARGGQVVFVRMPSSGGRLALEDEYHPKAKYWDRFAAMSSGVCIHSLDLSRARGLKCPDDSHLDYRDAARFTGALVDELIQRQAVNIR